MEEKVKEKVIIIDDQSGVEGLLLSWYWTWRQWESTNVHWRPGMIVENIEIKSVIKFKQNISSENKDDKNKNELKFFLSMSFW